MSEIKSDYFVKPRKIISKEKNELYVVYPETSNLKRKASNKFELRPTPYLFSNIAKDNNVYLWYDKSNRNNIAGMWDFNQLSFNYSLRPTFVLMKKDSEIITYSYYYKFLHSSDEDRDRKKLKLNAIYELLCAFIDDIRTIEKLNGKGLSSLTLLTNDIGDIFTRSWLVRFYLDIKAGKLYVGMTGQDKKSYYEKDPLIYLTKERLFTDNYYNNFYWLLELADLDALIPKWNFKQLSDFIEAANNRDTTKISRSIDIKGFTSLMSRVVIAEDYKHTYTLRFLHENDIVPLSLDDYINNKNLLKNIISGAVPQLSNRIVKNCYDFFFGGDS